MKSTPPMPTPSEMQLLDGKDSLQQMKEHQPRLYRWRALFGVVILLCCAVAGYVLFKDAVSIIAWFEDVGPIGPVLFSLTIALSILLLIPSPLLKALRKKLRPLVSTRSARHLPGNCMGAVREWFPSTS